MTPGEGGFPLLVQSHFGQIVKIQLFLSTSDHMVTVFDEHERLKKYYIHMETCITIIDQGLPKFRPMLGTYMAFEQGGRSFLCHTCCDIGPWTAWFLWSHLKDHTIYSPCPTSKGYRGPILT